MKHILYEMFGWPQGIVIGNLIASALWAAPALVHLHRKLNKRLALCSCLSDRRSRHGACVAILRLSGACKMSDINYADYPGTGPHYPSDLPESDGTPPEPPLAEVEQERPEGLISVPVEVRGIVTSRQAPTVTAAMRSVVVQNASDHGSDLLFGDDPRRSRLVLIANTGPIIIALSKAEADSGMGAHIPTGGIVEITHRKAIYVNTEAGVQTLSYILELFAD